MENQLFSLILDFADMYMNPTLKANRIDNNHPLESYLKFLKRHKSRKHKGYEKNFEHMNKSNGLKKQKTCFNIKCKNIYFSFISFF